MTLLSGPVYFLHDDPWETGVYIVDQGGFIMEEARFEELVRNVRQFYIQARRVGLNIAAENENTWLRWAHPPPRGPAMRKPRPGYVYLFRDKAGLCKIGCSANPKQRARNISQPNYSIDIVCAIWAEDMAALEQSLHKRFAEKRVKGEWFELNEDDIEYIRSLGR